MKKLTILALTTAAIIASANAYAGHGGKCSKHHKKDKMFEMIDADKDGFITKAEQLSFSEKKFSETDLNRDGKVTKEEMKDHFKQMRKKWKAEWQAKKGDKYPKAD